MFVLIIIFVMQTIMDSEYEYYKKLAIEKCGIEDIVSTKKRTKNRKTFIDDGPAKLKWNIVIKKMNWIRPRALNHR
ncbi:hypothetical protein QTP88_019154 [Uroleucon formosanum]